MENAGDVDMILIAGVEDATDRPVLLASTRNEALHARRRSSALAPTEKRATVRL